MKRENVIGRANVEDTPELEAYYASLEGEALGALWNVANDIEPWYPKPKSVPILWKWKRIEPLVRRAPELVSAEKAARRVVMLVNPGRQEWSAAAGWMAPQSLSSTRHVGLDGDVAGDGRGNATVLWFEGNGSAVDVLVVGPMAPPMPNIPYPLVTINGSAYSPRVEVGRGLHRSGVLLARHTLGVPWEPRLRGSHSPALRMHLGGRLTAKNPDEPPQRDERPDALEQDEDGTHHLALADEHRAVGNGLAAAARA